MPIRLRHGMLLAAAVALTSGCAGRYFQDAGPPPPPPRYTLATLPSKEIWTGVIFNGAKIGFSHFRIEPSAELHRLRSEATMRLRFLGFDKSIRLRAEDWVRDDLSLERFAYDYHIDGSDLRVRGEVAGRELAVGIETAGVWSRQKLALAGPLYPASALTLFPVLAGLAIGREHRFMTYSGELQQLGEVSQRVESFERSTLFEGSAFKVATEFMGLRTTTWIDVRGRPVLELGLNGVIVSALEDEATAKGYLASAALNKDDVIIQWSLVRTDRPLPQARHMRRLRLVLEGAPLPVSSDARQACVRGDGEVVCRIVAAQQVLAAPGDAAAFLAPSVTVQSAHASIRALERTILSGLPLGADRIQALLKWMEGNIRKEAADVFSALDALQSKRAECQGQTYLYAALARAAGIPTRVANGLVYSPEHEGFLYHTWAESLVDDAWQAVDPTFDQRSADATHLALVYGETLADLLPLVEWVGKTRIRVLEAEMP